MFANDYIMRQIEGLSRMLARVLFDRDMESEELHLDEDGTLSGQRRTGLPAEKVAA